MWSKDKVILTLELSTSELNENYRILKQSELKVWMPRLPASADLDTARKHSDKACRDYSRHLHNYLNSFASLIDHMRRISQNIENTRQYAEYQREKEKYAIIEVQVAKDLHNFSRHRNLSIAGQKVGLMFKNREELEKNNPYSVSFSPPSLLTKDLLDDETISATTREYLQKLGDELILQTVIDEAHQALVASSYCLYKRIVML